MKKTGLDILGLIAIAAIITMVILTFVGCGSKGVIGVVYNQEGQVRHAYSGGPAANAGISEGDKILYHRSTKGAPNTTARVKWIDVSDNNKLREADVKRIHIDELGSSQW